MVALFWCPQCWPWQHAAALLCSRHSLSLSGYLLAVDVSLHSQDSLGCYFWLSAREIQFLGLRTGYNPTLFFSLPPAPSLGAPQDPTFLSSSSSLGLLGEAVTEQAPSVCIVWG